MTEAVVVATDARADPIARLRRFAEPQSHCQICAAVLANKHAHVWDCEITQPVCACQACVLLLVGGSGRYRAIPTRVIALPDLVLDDAEWQALGVPINLAYFVSRSGVLRSGVRQSGAQGDAAVMAYYPSPAGPVGAQVDADAWAALCRRQPEAATLERDVAALLVAQLDGLPGAFVVPIDKCLELVGLLRGQWRGLRGGDGVRGALAAFFGELARLQARGANTTERA